MRNRHEAVTSRPKIFPLIHNINAYRSVTNLFRSPSTLNEQTPHYHETEVEFAYS